MVEKGSESVFLNDIAGEGAAALRRAAWPPSDAFHRAIVTSTKLIVMATNATGIIQLFNAGAERMLGYSAVEVVGKMSPLDMQDPEELKVRAREVSRELSTPIAADFEALTCKASLGIEDCYQSTLIAKNRERIPVAIAITVMRDDMGRIAGYSLILTDISIRQRGFAPSDAPSALPAVEPSQSDLLTRMSHEMRTPLSAILGFAQLMDAGQPSPTFSQKRSIARILQAGWHLEKLIGMARDLALIESGNLSLSIESVPLAAAMLECQANVESQAQTRGVRVTFPLFETPCFVSADRNRLQEVFSHMVSAAIDRSDGQSAIVVECDTHSAEWVRINIHDADAALERPTRSFPPADDLNQKASTADETGIGLALAQRLIELMGGAIGAAGNDVTRKELSFDLKRILAPVATGTSRRDFDSTDDGPHQRDELLETLLVAFNASETSAAKKMLRSK